jgi:hypothetical protein
MSSIRRAGVALACGVLLLGAARVSLAGGNPCPPHYVHCQEKGPKIKFKCGCPRPVCPPCDSPWFGYYPTCWSPWGAGCPNCPSQNPPWVPEGHAAVPHAPMPHLGAAPPGVTVPGTMDLVPPPQTAPAQPRSDTDGREEMPTPRQLQQDDGPRLKQTSAPAGRPRLNGYTARYGAYHPGE